MPTSFKTLSLSDDDITLLEIDLSKDTDKDPEKLEKDAEAKDTADADTKKDNQENR